jgi:hypothetical protein
MVKEALFSPLMFESETTSILVKDGQGRIGEVSKLFRRKFIFFTAFSVCSCVVGIKTTTF